MAATFYFLEAPNCGEVLKWFREQREEAQGFPKAEGVLLHYSDFGALALDEHGEVDVHHSPLVSVIPSRVRRQALWTVGEVHFLSNDNRLEALRRRFQSWLRSHELVWDQSKGEGASAHFLEGSVRNIARKIYALPSGLEALSGGQFFVADSDNEAVVDRVCKSLRLQGVQCA